jgi:hypothetical protein
LRSHDDGFRALVHQPVWNEFPFAGGIYDAAYTAAIADPRGRELWELAKRSGVAQ